MYKVRERAPHSGLYRCTTCGVLIPVDAGERLPTCPSRCADGIWTFYNEKPSLTPGQTRETVESFQALDLGGDPAAIPVGAWLTEVSLGPEANSESEPTLAAFNFEGRVYFVSARELLQKTKEAQS